MRDDPRRLVKAVVVAGLTGAAIVSLASHLVLPALAQRLTASQIAWLRDMFNQHAGVVLFAILFAAALLGLPVFLAALWAARLGPWRK